MDLSVIIPTHRRSQKLRTLIEGIAATDGDHDRFEVIVVVDGLDPAPLEVADLLPPSIRFTGLTKEHAGPAAARNFALGNARGDWALFYDDDARIEPATIPGHLRRIAEAPGAAVAWLGRVDWPAELVDSPWRTLLAETSMLFFWNRMADGDACNYRHFWTSNLSVRRDLVANVGGFCERFPSPMHEDIELGWRLQETHGVRVRVDRSIHSLHDHPLDPVDYLRREHVSGLSARAARDINRPFHDSIWHWVGDAEATLDTLERLFEQQSREVLARLEDWSRPSDERPSAAVLEIAYAAHLPLKRIAFLRGYTGRPFEMLWDDLHANGRAENAVRPSAARTSRQTAARS